MSAQWLTKILGTKLVFTGAEKTCKQAQYECKRNLINVMANGWDLTYIHRILGFASKNKKQTIRYTFILSKTKDTARLQKEILDMPIERAIEILA